MSSLHDKMHYSPVNPEQESRESLLDEHHLKQPEKSPDKWRHRLRIALSIAGVGIACLVAGLIGYYWQHDLDGRCTRHNSEYSPMADDVTYHRKMFNGSFIKQTIYREDASPEVDEAWEALGVNYRAVKISPEEAHKAGISQDHVKINKNYGGGFPVNVEGLHHLHCLNLLRQALYYNHEHYRNLGQGAFKNDDYIVKRHVSHCLDIIRQQLMCTVDVGVFGQVWLYPEDPEPFVDFNTQHRCRNFEHIREWAEQRQLPEDVPQDFLEPPKMGDHVYTAVP